MTFSTYGSLILKVSDFGNEASGKLNLMLLGLNFEKPSNIR
jgi:hypothetical protein